ncbi:TrkH family potassium uptake protein [Bacteroides sp. 519]|uniref:TrkH family potassium uptake protein n=1 Tax=Bacteroides sp. 519 TaxID=2302937 RepID=UPI0013CFE401|nr:potassium transporter TrkG [Bacteroides sp. 519]NDV56601.1 potassium transporter [Bacteroides sp. 519]
MKHFRRYQIDRNKKLEPFIRRILDITSTVINLASLLFIIVVIYEYGFRTTETQNQAIQTFYYVVWIVFFIDITFHVFLQYARFPNQNYRKLAWVLSVLVYLASLPAIFPEVGNNEYYAPIWKILSSNIYNHTVLLIFSFLNLSHAVIKLLGKKTNPSLILAGSFLIFIIIGAGLLMMPRCTINGIAWVDSLFVATSAVCITGLSSVDFVSTFTPQGMFIVIILVQIGGLGVMTLTSFFALFFMGNTSLYNQLVVRDMVNSNSIDSLFSTLLYILAFTLAIEIGGMLIIWATIHGTMDMSLKGELLFSAFHAISGFCNAGFTTLPGNLGDPLVVQNNSLLITMAFLVILGGVGFPILVNLKNVIVYYAKRFWSLFVSREEDPVLLLHPYNLNTRIALTTTTILFVATTIFFVVFEWNNAFAGLSVGDKWTQAFFNAVCPRSGGFTTVNLSTFGVQTILLYILMMWIGGSSQSTAGGIKVNAFAVITLNLFAILRNSDRVEAFGREIPINSVRRANATMVMSLGIIFISVLLLSIMEPELSLLSLTFECISALSTTGASLNTSPLLSDYSKILITILMFIGRIGIITLILGLIKQKPDIKYRYPQEQIIIN